jgi:pimeloyl-ACP methyl ester carboxylesterase
MTFDRLTDAIEQFTMSVGLERYSLYMFDFGAPVGFRLAVRHPERRRRTRDPERERL